MRAKKAILANKNIIVPEDLPNSIQNTHHNTSPSTKEVFKEESLAEMEKIHILNILEHYGWNQKSASEILGISTTTLWRKLKSYGIEPKQKE